MKQFVIAVMLLAFFSSCRKEGLETTTRDLDAANFTKLNMGSDFDIQVKKGAGFRVTATGRERDVNDLKTSVQNGELFISFKNVISTHKRIVLTITMPSLTQFNFRKNSNVDVDGFTEIVPVSGSIEENTKAVVRMNAPELKLDASGDSRLSVSGQASRIEARAGSNSFIDCYGVAAQNGTAFASRNSQVKIFASAVLFAEANSNSRIYYKGNPPANSFSASNNSSIIPE